MQPIFNYAPSDVMVHKFHKSYSFPLQIKAININFYYVWIKM